MESNFSKNNMFSFHTCMTKHGHAHTHTGGGGEGRVRPPCDMGQPPNYKTIRDLYLKLIM